MVKLPAASVSAEATGCPETVVSHFWQETPSIRSSSGAFGT